ncbi:hypothetical protein E2C01_009586 [Portunus trituberculatus]|uniref:Uncharacterized protein n=1 Tax=Portunus trituberculatus TaxID=210409 RepID=A0A5B7D661_PORTR|nr:hypothetical protein [Portunus trituberculatus]
MTEQICPCHQPTNGQDKCPAASCHNHNNICELPAILNQSPPAIAQHSRTQLGRAVWVSDAGPQHPALMLFMFFHCYHLLPAVLDHQQYWVLKLQKQLAQTGVGEVLLAST